MEQQNRIDPVLKVFFFLLLLTGVAALAYHPLLLKRFPEELAPFEAYRGVYHGVDFLDNAADLKNGRSSGTVLFKRDSMTVSFVPAASRLYLFGAHAPGRESLLCEIRRGSAVVATTADAPRSRSGSVRGTGAFSHAHGQYHKVSLEKGVLYEFVIIDEEHEMVGKKITFSVGLYDGEVMIVQIWSAFAGLLLFLYLCRIAHLILKMIRLNREEATPA